MICTLYVICVVSLWILVMDDFRVRHEADLLRTELERALVMCRDRDQLITRLQQRQRVLDLLTDAKQRADECSNPNTSTTNSSSSPSSL